MDINNKLVFISTTYTQYRVKGYIIIVLQPHSTLVFHSSGDSSIAKYMML